MSFTHQGRTLTKIAVIGSGQIGPDIALYFAKVLAPSGVRIVVVDVAEAALAKGKAKLEKKVARGVESKAFTEALQQQMLSALTWTTDYSEISGAELVLEAATEDKALKARIFTQVEGLVPAGAILASNSSHLEPEVIFENAKDRSRTTVIHYFFPAERNLIVEVVPSEHTAPAVTSWLMSFYETIGKVPVQVTSRYGYALDPIFEGVFLAAARIAESGRATTKQIDAVATKALGMTVGSFTAMNLTGGNPITAVGLDNYTTKINGWFGTPQILKDMVAARSNWDVPGRGETVDVPEALATEITEELRGAYFGLCGEIVDAGLISIGDFDMALEVALDMKPAFRFMNELTTSEALRLVEAYAMKNPGFPIARCIRMHGVENRPFAIPVITRRDQDGIAVLTIRRPKVLNALNQGVFDELRQKLTEVENDTSVRGTVLTGFGTKAFVSGADVGFLAEIQNSAQGEATSRASQEVVNSIAATKKPIVCAMNGLAFGGGNEVAMACTMRIAKKGQKVFVAQPEPNLGIIPGAGGTQRLPRLIGLERAATMLRTGKPISSEVALTYGLISEEVATDLVPRAIQLAQELADGKRVPPKIETGPLAHVPAELPAVDIGHLSRKVDSILCKAILEGARTTLDKGIEIEIKAFGEVCGTKDMRIGVDNFLKNGPRAPAAFTHS